MPRAAALRVLEALGSHLLVVLAQTLLRHGHARSDVGKLQLQVLQRHSLLGHVARLVLLVRGRHIRWIDNRLRGELRRRDRHVVDIARLALEFDAAPDLARRGEGRDADAILELPDLEVAPELDLELGFRSALRPQQRGVTVARKPAIHLQRRNLLEPTHHRLVADAITHLVDVLYQDFATDGVVQQLRLLFLDERRRQFVARGLLQFALALLPGTADLLGGDALAVDLGSGDAGRGLELDAPENEHDGDGAQEHGSEPAGDLVSNLLQHRMMTGG